jgi:hypothetical protein
MAAGNRHKRDLPIPHAAQELSSQPDPSGASMTTQEFKQLEATEARKRLRWRRFAELIRGGFDPSDALRALHGSRNRCPPGGRSPRTRLSPSNSASHPPLSCRTALPFGSAQSELIRRNWSWSESPITASRRGKSPMPTGMRSTGRTGCAFTHSCPHSRRKPSRGSP